MCYFFFGFGIVIRIIGEVIFECVVIVCKVDYIFISMICEVGIYNEMFQVYVGFDINRVVGVMGDVCVYGYIIIFCVVIIINFMMVELYEFKFDFFKKIVRRIVNEVDGVVRVMYDIISKFFGIIELE